MASPVTLSVTATVTSTSVETEAVPASSAVSAARARAVMASVRLAIVRSPIDSGGMLTVRLARNAFGRAGGGGGDGGGSGDGGGGGGSGGDGGGGDGGSAYVASTVPIAAPHGSKGRVARHVSEPSTRQMAVLRASSHRIVPLERRRRARCPRRAAGENQRARKRASVAARRASTASASGEVASVCSNSPRPSAAIRCAAAAELAAVTSSARRRIRRSSAPAAASSSSARRRTRRRRPSSASSGSRKVGISTNVSGTAPARIELFPSLVYVASSAELFGWIGTATETLGEPSSFHSK